MLCYKIESSLAALKSQVSVIDRQIQERRLIRNRVLDRCGQREEAKEHRGNDGAVTIESQDTQYLLFRKVKAPYTLKEISIATKQCFVDSSQKHLPIYFQTVVIVPLKNIRDGRFTEASLAFLPIDSTGTAPNILRLPAGTSA